MFVIILIKKNYLPTFFFNKYVTNFFLVVLNRSDRKAVALHWPTFHTALNFQRSSKYFTAVLIVATRTFNTLHYLSCTGSLKCHVSLLK